MSDDVIDRVGQRGDGDISLAEAPADAAAGEQGAEMARSEQRPATEEAAPASAQTGTEHLTPPPAEAGNGAPPSGLSELGSILSCPVPRGAALFGQLTSAFVDGQRLLQFLADRKHTGALVATGPSRAEIAVIYEGAVIGLISTSDGITRRLSRLSLSGPGSGEEHELTVFTYRPEVALAVGQMINLPVRFEGLHGSFVDFPALLSFLRRENASGAVRISTHVDVGVVLLRNGEVLGAYSGSQPDLDDAETVFALAREPDAEIDVHVGSPVAPAGAPGAATVGA
ncbi:MAG: hypothetical protein E6J14_12195 [Chloroflexi bacterium]|nr:MAG: hypothetical protein E6J14_12195 [Chloroflexota bacterium]